MLKIKKIAFSLFVTLQLLSGVNQITANPISSTLALKVAKNFYHRVSFHPTQNLTLVGDTSAYFIFNVARDSGFVIIAADDAALPILGYSLTGNFATTNTPPQLIWWMNGYKQQIQFIQTNNILPTAQISNQWFEFENNIHRGTARTGSSVAPLLSTTWDQSPFYNYDCPYDYSIGNYTVTGCVATTMAQIMKYWNYPSHGTGSHSYTPPNTNLGSQYANFGSTTYNWSAMPSNVSSTNNDVATLMYHCGVSVDMNYGVSASSAYVITATNSICAQSAYTTYFGYNSSTIQGLQSANYSSSAWISLLENELNNRRPIQYAGYGSSGGHTWVCDGYDAFDNLHMNWGWGGIANTGYWPVSALNPRTYSFNNNQQAIIGIQPAASSVSCNNDFACNPMALSINSSCVNSSCSTVGASPASYTIPFYGGSSCSVLYNNSRMDDDVWFSITPTTANPVTITVTPTSNLSNFDPAFGIYSGACLSLSSNLVCADAHSNGVAETVTFTPTAFTTYLIRVFSYGLSTTESGDFDICATSIPTSYTISTTASPSAGGSTLGGGSFNSGSTCSLSASANPNYTFVNWTENGSQVSANPNYSSTVTANRNLVANFNQNTSSYTISTSASPSAGGSTSGGGSFNSGSTCSLSASANTGYTFVNWTENGSLVSSSSNYNFTVTSTRNLVANFSVNSSCTPVTIATNPSNQSATVGGTATFSVFVNGTPPFTYQWYKNGASTVISTTNTLSTANSYTTPVLTAGDNGNTYSCIITNCSGSGSIQTNSATLTVCTPVTIGTQPISQSAPVGGTATFSVIVNGAPPFSYQWIKNGSFIIGATNSSYTTPVLTAGDNGNTYSCIITNCSGSGSIQTNSATLTVTSNPPQFGSVNVTINPSGAVSAGAQWNLDGGSWQSSGTTLNNIATGSHTVNFSTVTGWTSPNNQLITVTSGNTYSTTGTYTQGGALAANFYASQISGCAPLTVDFFDSSTGSPQRYIWDFLGNGVNPTVSTSQNPTGIRYSTPGSYTVRLTIVGNGNSDVKVKPAYITVLANCTGISNNLEQNGFSIYPNPTNSELTIDAAGNKVEQVRVFNVNGQKVAEFSNPANNKITVSELTNGIYFIEATVKGSVLRGKFVKE